MDDRERRQLRREFEVDEVIPLDVPLWYLRLTQPLRRSWRRELLTVLALLAGFAVLGFTIGRVTA